MEEFTLIVPDEGCRRAITGKRYANRARALFEPLLLHQRILRQIVDAQLGEWLCVKLLDSREPNAVHEKALSRRQQLPERVTLHGWDDELCGALDGQADEKTLSLLLATKLDGFPRGMAPNVRTYVEAQFWSLAITLLRQKSSLPPSCEYGARTDSRRRLPNCWTSATMRGSAR